ncbi:MAG: GNAT family N-acetyltransferase [Candidatus Limnocylindria bacterium]
MSVRPWTPLDDAALADWANDPEFARLQWGTEQDPPHWTVETARAFAERFAAPEGALFAIDHDRRPVGFANYRRLNEHHGNADVGIAIGESSLWGRGLGSEALRLLARHLLDDRGLHRLRLHVVATNDRAIAAYKRCGFEVEGIERDGVRATETRWADMAVMGLVRASSAPTAFDPRPATLSGEHVRLEPLRMEHAPDLFLAADHAELWTWVSSPPPKDVDAIAAYIRQALDNQVLGKHVPFLVRDAGSGTAIGTTRYANIDRANRSTEIGWTFYEPERQRTAVNTEAKLLLLRHAFEELGAIRVWLQTDEKNDRSRRAIERLGAIQEAVLRKERILWNGRIRTSVVFGITDDEWPGVRARLRGYLGRA